MGGNDQWISYLAWVLIAFISISSQVFIFWPWLFGSWSTASKESVDPFGSLDNVGSYAIEDESDFNPLGYFSIMWENLNVQALLYLVPFNFAQIMLCWNYYLTMTTDPGSPPFNWNPPSDGSSMEYKKTTHTPRYCRTCDAYKPPRTHHCRTCKKCVLKMDHHCPWVRNCVGYFNYGHFVRFIIWTTIATFICAALLILRCWEAYENEKLGIIKCPYHQGILTNFQEVLGQNPLLWLWPQPMLGDGLSFKVRAHKSGSRRRKPLFRKSSEDDMSSCSSASESPAKTSRWFSPFDSSQQKHDELVEMV
ncbi:Palmitoyltransferase [Haplosporangium sp. Z 27]|nr:Palmitoyltransferase [Haplosporangium sp. Z 27]